MLADKFTCFRADLLEHRWGYLIKACQMVAELECTLRLTWNTRALSVKGKARDLRDEEEGVSNDQVNQAANFVMTPAMWIYMHMLLSLAKVINLFEAWFKACPCHSTAALGTRGESWARRQRQFLESLGLPDGFSHRGGCPMTGCKAPFAAAGEHWVRCSAVRSGGSILHQLLRSGGSSIHQLLRSVRDHCDVSLSHRSGSL